MRNIKIHKAPSTPLSVIEEGNASSLNSEDGNDSRQLPDYNEVIIND